MTMHSYKTTYSASEVFWKGIIIDSNLKWNSTAWPSSNKTSSSALKSKGTCTCTAGTSVYSCVLEFTLVLRIF